MQDSSCVAIIWIEYSNHRAHPKLYAMIVLIFGIMTKPAAIPDQ